jgi:hypothetical protein
VISDIFGATATVGDVGRGDLRHQLGLSGNRVAVKRRQHQTAPVPVRVVVDHQHRTVTE